MLPVAAAAFVWSACQGSAPHPATVDSAAAAPRAVAVCTADSLGVRRASMHAGAGQRRVTYAFTNKGKTTCSLGGYPGFAPLAADGSPLSGVHAVPAANPQPSGPVSIPGGGTAEFTVAFTGIRVSHKPCVHAVMLAITPPGGAIALPLGDSLSICGDRQIQVAPIQAAAATSATP